jgi:hypothetical protein
MDFDYQKGNLWELETFKGALYLGFASGELQRYKAIAPSSVWTAPEGLGGIISMTTDGNSLFFGVGAEGGAYYGSERSGEGRIYVYDGVNDPLLISSPRSTSGTLHLGIGVQVLLYVPPRPPFPIWSEVEIARDTTESIRRDTGLFRSFINIFSSSLRGLWQDLRRILEILRQRVRGLDVGEDSSNPDLGTLLHSLTLWSKTILRDIELLGDDLEDLKEAVGSLQAEIEGFKDILEPEEGAKLSANAARLFSQLAFLQRQLNGLEGDFDDLEDLFEDTFETFQKGNLTRVETLLGLAQNRMMVVGARMYEIEDILSLTEKILIKMERDLERMARKLERESLSSSSLEAPSLTKVKLYPNPIKSLATLEVKGQGIKSIEIQIFNLTGKELFKKDIQGTIFSFEARDTQGNPLANGVYLYVITVRGYDGQVIRSEVRKLVVLR